VAIKDISWREMIALKAIVEPMLIKLSRMVMAEVTITALAGICVFGLTVPIHLLMGRPPSRAKEKV